jgi:hypothetical protein
VKKLFLILYWSILWLLIDQSYSMSLRNEEDVIMWCFLLHRFCYLLFVFLGAIIIHRPFCPGYARAVETKSTKSCLCIANASPGSINLALFAPYNERKRPARTTLLSRYHPNLTCCIWDAYHNDAGPIFEKRLSWFEGILQLIAFMTVY